VSAPGTRLFQLLLLWGTFAALVLPYACWRIRQNDAPITQRAVLWSLSPAVAVILLWLLWDVVAKVFGGVPGALEPNKAASGFGDRVSDRGWNWLTAFVLAGALGLLVLALWREVEDAKRSIDERLSHIIALTLATTATLLILGVEFIYIRDTFDSRMNTIFKLYYQAWLLLSVAGGFALYELARGIRWPSARAAQAGRPQPGTSGWSLGEYTVLAWTVAGMVIGVVLANDGFSRALCLLIGGGLFFGVSAASVLLWRASAPRAEEASVPGTELLSWRAAWGGVVAALLVAAFAYPVLATYNRTNSFTGTRTLDGFATLPPDQRDAIGWLQKLDGAPVIAEAVGDDYRIETGGLYSASTGLPSIIQWIGHELQWRGTGEGLDPRKDDVETLYTSTTAADVQSVLQKYDIRYVIVGPAERQKYPGLSVDQMDGLMDVAFQQGDVTIYRVQPAILTQAQE
jgi:uncharacterized membrane protein